MARQGNGIAPILFEHKNPRRSRHHPRPVLAVAEARARRQNNGEHPCPSTGLTAGACPGRTGKRWPVAVPMRFPTCNGKPSPPRRPRTGGNSGCVAVRCPLAASSRSRPYRFRGSRIWSTPAAPANREASLRRRSVEPVRRDRARLGGGNPGTIRSGEPRQRPSCPASPADPAPISTLVVQIIRLVPGSEGGSRPFSVIQLRLRNGCSRPSTDSRRLLGTFLRLIAQSCRGSPFAEKVPSRAV